MLKCSHTRTYQNKKHWNINIRYQLGEVLSKLSTDLAALIYEQQNSIDPQQYTTSRSAFRYNFNFFLNAVISKPTLLSLLLLHCCNVNEVGYQLSHHNLLFHPFRYSQWRAAQAEPTTSSPMASQMGSKIAGFFDRLTNTSGPTIVRRSRSTCINSKASDSSSSKYILN